MSEGLGFGFEGPGRVKTGLHLILSPKTVHSILGMMASLGVAKGGGFAPSTPSTVWSTPHPAATLRHHRFEPFFCLHLIPSPTMHSQLHSHSHVCVCVCECGVNSAVNVKVHAFSM